MSHVTEPKEMPNNSSNRKRPSKLPIPQQHQQPRKTVTNSKLECNQNTKVENEPRNFDFTPETSLNRKLTSEQVSSSRTRNKNLISAPAPASDQALPGTSAVVSYAKKTENSQKQASKTVPVGRIQSKDDVNTRTITMASFSDAPVSEIRTNHEFKFSSAPSSEIAAITSVTSYSRSTKLPRYISSPRKSVLGVASSEEIFSAQHHKATTKLRSSTTTKQPTTGTLANGPKNLASVKPHNDIKSEPRKLSSSSIMKATTEVFPRIHNNNNSLNSTQKTRKKQVRYSDVIPARLKTANKMAATTTKAKDPNSNNEELTPRSDTTTMTTSGIIETKSPCLLETTSDSDLDSTTASRGPGPVGQTEPEMSNVEESKSLEQLWVNLVTEKPSDTLNYYSIGISHMKPPSRLAHLDDRSSSPIDLIPPSKQKDMKEKIHNNNRNYLNSPTNDQSMTSDIRSHESNTSCCDFSSKPESLASLTDAGRARAPAETRSNDEEKTADAIHLPPRENSTISFNLIHFSSVESLSQLQDSCKPAKDEGSSKNMGKAEGQMTSGPMEDKACTGDWEMIAQEGQDQRKHIPDPLYEGPDKLNIYVVDGGEDVTEGLSTPTQVTLDTKVALSVSHPNDSLPVVSYTIPPGPPISLAISGSQSKDCGFRVRSLEDGCAERGKASVVLSPETGKATENCPIESLDVEAVSRSKSACSSSSQFSDCSSTLSVGSESSLVSLPKKQASANESMHSEQPEERNGVQLKTDGLSPVSLHRPENGPRETPSSLSLRPSQVVPLKVESVSLCVAALLSKSDPSGAHSNVQKENRKVLQELVIETTAEERNSTQVTGEVGSSVNNIVIADDQNSESTLTNEQTSSRSYETYESSSNNDDATSEVIPAPSQHAKIPGNHPQEVPSKPKIEDCSILGSRITIAVGNLHGTCAACTIETSKHGRPPWKPNSRTAQTLDSSKTTSRNSPHKQLDYLIIDRTVSMYNVGSHLEGFLRIRNHSCKTICYRVSSVVPGKYQIIPPEGKLAKNETTAITIASATPATFTQYEVDQFKVETIVVPTSVASLSEQRLYWKEVAIGSEVQTTMVGRMRILNPGCYYGNHLDGHTSSGDGLPLPHERRRTEEEDKCIGPSSTSICVYTLIIGLAAAVIHHYSTLLDAF